MRILGNRSAARAAVAHTAIALCTTGCGGAADAEPTPERAAPPQPAGLGIFSPEAWDEHQAAREFVSDAGANRIQYVDMGSGDPIVWLHGGGVDHRMWAPQLTHFAGTNRVIAYDLRGHGRSTFVDNERPDADDFVRLMDALELDRVDLVGLSLGAVMALDIVLAHPERVRRLVLVSPGLSGVQEGDPSYLEPLLEIGQALGAGDVETAMAVIDRITFEGQRTETVPELAAARAYVRAAATAHFDNGFQTRVPNLIESAPAERLGDVEAPTLIVHGSHDLPYMAGNVAALAAGIPRNQVVEMDAGHILNVEVAAGLNDILDAYLRSLVVPTISP